jgi:hypothetical protein
MANKYLEYLEKAAFLGFGFDPEKEVTHHFIRAYNDMAEHGNKGIKEGHGENYTKYSAYLSTPEAHAITKPHYEELKKKFEDNKQDMSLIGDHEGFHESVKNFMTGKPEDWGEYR